MPPLHTFEITVQRRSGDGWPVVAEQSESGVFLPVRYEGVLRLDPVEVRSQSTPRDYGTVLGEALFRDDVRDGFVAALSKSRQPLHVLLSVEDPELRGLHWERLCARFEGPWDFLGLHQQTPFSLYLPSVTDRRFPPLGRRDLRALVLVAAPEGLGRYGLASFDAAAAVKGVRASLGSIPCDVLAHAEGAAGPPTLDALCECLTAERYSLLHVVCHGRYQEHETALYLSRHDGTADQITGSLFLERLCRLTARLPLFAFLSTCQSAVPTAGEALGGLAQRMVHDPGLGMPAVLAMSESVSVETALKLAEAFYARLREHGAVDLALAEACAGLAGRADITVPVLCSRLAGRPLFSDTPDRPLTVKEIEYGLGRVRELLGSRAPVWLTPQPPETRAVFDQREAAVRETLYAEHAELGEQKQKDRGRALDDVGNLCDEALERSFAELALGKEPPAYDERCPFRGLYPFRAEDREFFFGRETLVNKLEGRLAEAGFLAVLGPSGCGKSSLILAGLAPALQGKEPGFELAYLTPTSEPGAALDACLEVNKNLSLLVVDQFEELFTLCGDEGKRRDFIDRLLGLCGRTRVVVAMRADFWGECAPYPPLRERMQAHQELIAPMDAAELRRAMEMQAARVGLRFEADLSHTILEEVQGEPGAMPLLQHALRELWKRRHGRWLRAGEYRAVGGVRRAIAETAEAAYRDQPPREREWMRNIFLRLTRLDVDTDGVEEWRDTRQRVWLEEIIPVGADALAVKTLVKRLADARLVVTGLRLTKQREEGGHPTDQLEEVEVAHEAVIRHWDRLRNWLEKDRDSLLLQRRLTEAAKEWASNPQEHKEGFLYSRARLAVCQEWAQTHRQELNPVEAAFLAASEEAERQREQKELEVERTLRKAAEEATNAERRRVEEAERAAKREKQLRSWANRLNVALVICLSLIVWWAYSLSKMSDLRLELDKIHQSDSLMPKDHAPEQNLGSPGADELAQASWSYLGRDSVLAKSRQDPKFLAVLPSLRALSSDSKVAVEWQQHMWRDDGGLILWSNYHGVKLHEWPLRVPEGRVVDLVFSRSGKILAAIYHAGSEKKSSGVILWDVATCKRLSQQPSSLVDEEVSSMDLNPSEKLLAIGYRPSKGEGRVRLWDIEVGGFLTRSEFAVPEGAVSSVAFNPKEEHVNLAVGYSGGAKSGVILWTKNGQRYGHPLEVARGEVTSVAFSPRGKAIAAGYRCGEGCGGVVVWSVYSRRLLVGTPLDVKGEVNSVAFNRDGTLVAAGYANGRKGGVQLWDVAGGGQLGGGPFEVSEGRVFRVGFRKSILREDNELVVAGFGTIDGTGGLLSFPTNVGSWKEIVEKLPSKAKSK